MLFKKPTKFKHLSAQERTAKIIQLLILLIPILVSYVTNFGLKIPLPGCPLLSYLGIPCPGWGLTRSFQAIARGNISKAINFHLFGPVLFIIFLTLVFHLIQEIIRNKVLSNTYIKIIKNSNYQILFLLVLFSYHGTRLQSLGQTGELGQSFLNSPIIQWISTANWSVLMDN